METIAAYSEDHKNAKIPSVTNEELSMLKQVTRMDTSAL
jgi:hypothetical protein